MTHEHPETPEDTSTRTDDTAPLGWAVTQSMPYAGPAPTAPTAPTEAPAAPVAPPAAPATGEGEPEGSGSAPHTAPALDPPTWTGRKTAIAAALAIGISSVGAVGAAAALPAGTVLGDSGQVQRGGLGPGGQGGPGGRGGQGGPSGFGGQAPAAPGASTT